jgi:tripartite-type tricarboxylate transporter receptor subunit TctC
MSPLPTVQRSRLWLAAGLALAGLTGFAAAQAQDFPSKPVKIVVPFGPGGAGDLTARAVGAQLSTLWGKPVVIENKPGAGGVVAADSVVKADPDGHTLFLMSNGTAVTQALFQNLPFDTVRDLAPVSTLGYFDIVVVVPEGSPYKTFGELLAYAKANPGKLNIGSINVGSTQNLAAELFKSTAGIQGQVVPFNGTPALINALRGNQVDVGVEILGPVLTQIKANALRALAVTDDQRSVILPNVPTARESGVPALVISSWNALAAPAKTPAAVIQKLNKDIAAVLANPDVKTKLLNVSVEARGSTPERLKETLTGDIKRWTEVIQKAGIPRQ